MQGTSNHSSQETIVVTQCVNNHVAQKNLMLVTARELLVTVHTCNNRSTTFM